MTHKVMLYSTPTCPYCHMAADFLRKNGVKFTEIDVSADGKKAQEMVKKSGQMAVPVIDVDGKIIVGYDLPAIKKALEI